MSGLKRACEAKGPREHFSAPCLDTPFTTAGGDDDVGTVHFCNERIREPI